MRDGSPVVSTLWRSPAKRVGGDHAVNVCLISRDGKKRSFAASMFENYQEAMGQISSKCRMPFEQLAVGLLGVKWP